MRPVRIISRKDLTDATLQGACRDSFWQRLRGEAKSGILRDHTPDP